MMMSHQELEPNNNDQMEMMGMMGRQTLLLLLLQPDQNLLGDYPHPLFQMM